MEQESEQAAVEVAGVAWGFPQTPDSRDQLLRQMREITAGAGSGGDDRPAGLCCGGESTGALDEGREER